MIIVKLVGGLGNQLFQYSLGRQLAEKHQTTLRLDLTAFRSYKLHAYSLGHFNIKATIATPRDLIKFPPLKVIALLNKFLKVQKNRIEEPSLLFQEHILKSPNNVYLEGYWQSEKYFLGIRDFLLKELSVVEPLSGQNLLVAEKIKTSQAVSLHVRRGDYASNQKTQGVHGLCSLDYYQKAIQKINESVKDPHYYIFSDDPEWCKKNLKIDFPTTVVDHNDAKTNYEDLRLMSLCKHNIIANSSFSWWGAWLNPNLPKIVIAPQRWFADEHFQKQSQDIIPETWIKI